MRIMLLGNFEHPSWDGSIPDERNIADTLAAMGHETICIQREAANQIMIPKAPVDFTLVFQWDGYPDLVQLPHPLIYWAFDYQDRGQEWHEKLIKTADIYLSKRFSDGAHYGNWRWSCDFAPDFLGKHDKIEQDIDVLFTGSWLPWATERNQILQLIDARFNLVIHSANPDAWPKTFKHVNGPVHDHDLPHLIARAKVNVAVDHTYEAGYWSDRAAQILVCGGFVLQKYVPFMETYFHSTVAFFNGVEDIVAQVEWWLEHDEDREVFAAGAWVDSAHYTCESRVGDVLNIVRSVL